MKEVKNVLGTDAYNPITAKASKDRPRTDLIPAVAQREKGFIAKHGLIKYSHDNWKQAKEYRDYIRAAIDHLEYYLEGLDDAKFNPEASIYDAESGRTHLSHAALNVDFAIWHALIKHKIPPTKAEADEVNK